ncbi:MAG: hypothetical protein JWN93_1836 [Hyphomicrobiales bacterium]|nr:hypothetical protein [Hyphomicrobiales bacterium]
MGRAGLTTTDDPAAAALRPLADCLGPDAFNELMADFDDAAVEQTSVLTDELWGASRSSHLILRRGEAAAAGARVVVLTPPFLKRGLAYVKFGPFWRPRAGDPDIATYRDAVAALVEEYAHRRGHCLTAFVRPSREHAAAEADVLRDLGFVQRRSYPNPERYFVRVAPTADEQMGDIDQKWRYKLRQGLKHGLLVEMRQDAEAVAIFGALHDEMQRRKAMPAPAGLALLSRMIEGSPPSLRPQVFLASHEGRPVAGAIMVVAGDTAVYLYGAASPAGRDLNAGYVLQWRIIDWLRGLGLVHYDMGGTGGEQGLHQFKKGLLGRSGAIVAIPDEFDYWRDPRGRLGADLVFGARVAKRTLAGWKARLFKSMS